MQVCSGQSHFFSILFHSSGLCLLLFFTVLLLLKLKKLSHSFVTKITVAHIDSVTTVPSRGDLMEIQNTVAKKK